MAIYHLQAKVISRGAGRSAVAASAYMSCSEIYNDYDGITHNYTRKQGLVYEQVILPPHAPPEWADRSVLWNAVENAEKAKDSRLAREFVAALPVELDREQNISLITEYVTDNFVNEGMCADIAIHDTDGHNPHAHIMLTVRPLDDNSKWQAKTEKEYLCTKDGIEKGFTASEYKSAKADGWEKQYQYFIGKKKIYLPPSQADGLERINKYPKSTKYGRQNPLCEKWNSEEQLELWRKNLAEITNKYLESISIDERIDHRSHKARGLDEQPTIHEGVSARIMESRGIPAERYELNRQIKADNKLLRELKAQIKRLVETVKQSLPPIADTLETMRKNIMLFTYNIFHAQNRRNAAHKEIKATNETFDRYMKTTGELKEKMWEQKDLLEHKKATPIYKLIRHSELAKAVTTLTEDIEELRNEKNMLLKSLDCEKDGNMPSVKRKIADMELSITALQKQEQEYTAELDGALEDFANIKEHSQDLDQYLLIEERLRIRPQKQSEFYEEIEKTYGKRYDMGAGVKSILETDQMLGENLESERYSLRKTLQRLANKQRNHRRRIERDDELEL
ncbi:MAG: MobQ family relaxase [Clostridia bacterium]|nr:MobQ family relaxase [Clostridia bacterium]